MISFPQLRPRRRTLLAGTVSLALVCLTVSDPALAASSEGPEAPEPTAVETAERRLHEVPRVAGEIVVDGRIEEAVWREALRLTLDYETNPAENVPAPVGTELLLAYDEERLYAAFRAADPDPGAIRAHLADRDTAWDDDFVGIILDPFDDERRAFQFFVNPLGVQMDAFLDDVGGGDDPSWDAIWDSAGRITEAGFEVELSIPFSSLRFPASEGEQVWGIDALRFWPRGDRHRIALQPRDRGRNCHLCQVSKVRGFAGASPGMNLEIVPTLTAGRTDTRVDFPEGELEAGDFETEPGLTVRWGVTPNLNLNATLNPDFSQVEADVAQLDVNTRFTLFFPERRPFFLEGADFFSTPLAAVFTRNVVDPVWGAKVTGKVGASALGAFVAEDEVTSVLVPGSQSSRVASLPFETTDAVLRYRRDFGANSAVGALVTAREGGGGYSNLVGGVDGLVRFTDAQSVSFQLLSSASEVPGDLAAELAAPEASFGDTALRLSWNLSGRQWRAWAVHSDLGRDFRADLGFIPRVDLVRYVGGGERIWWGEEDDPYRRIGVGGEWNLEEDQDGGLLERETRGWANVSGPLQSFVNVTAGRRERTFAGVAFDESFGSLFAEARPSGDVGLGLFVRAGDEIDFAGVRPGEELRIEPRLTWNLGARLRTRWTHTRQVFDVEEGRLFTADLSQLRLVYQLDLRTFVRGVFQYRRVDRDPEVAAGDVEPLSESLFAQLLFSYKLNPRTVFFLGYGDERIGAEGLGLTAAGRSVFLKLGYAWLP